MPMDPGKIARMERDLAEAKRQYFEECGQKFEALMRVMTEEERDDIVGRIREQGTREEKTLFGFEIPEEPKRRGRGELARRIRTGR